MSESTHFKPILMDSPIPYFEGPDFEGPDFDGPRFTPLFSTPSKTIQDSGRDDDKPRRTPGGLQVHPPRVVQGDRRRMMIHINDPSVAMPADIMMPDATAFDDAIAQRRRPLLLSHRGRDGRTHTPRTSFRPQPRVVADGTRYPVESSFSQFQAI